MRISFALPRQAPVLALAVWAAACSESTTTFDPVALSQSTDAVIDAMENGSAVQSLGVLGDAMTLGAPSLATGTEPRRAAGGPAAIFPPGAPLGTTFVYDAAQQKYVASDQTGAPSNGVRFVLYAVPLGTPPSAIGHLDLLDLSTMLGVQAFLTSNATPVLDYTAGAAIQESGGTITSATLSGQGSVTGPALTVTLDTVTQSFSTSTGIGMHHQVSVPEQNLSIDFEAAISLLGFLQGTLSVQHGDNTTVVTGGGTQTSFSGTITHNGDEVITFSGPSTDPVFAFSSGDQPTAEQLAALRKLSDFTTALPCAIAVMLRPAIKLLTPGVPSLPCS